MQRKTYPCEPAVYTGTVSFTSSLVSKKLYQVCTSNICYLIWRNPAAALRPPPPPIPDGMPPPAAPLPPLLLIMGVAPDSPSFMGKLQTSMARLEIRPKLDSQPLTQQLCSPSLLLSRHRSQFVTTWRLTAMQPVSLPLHIVKVDSLGESWRLCHDELTLFQKLAHLAQKLLLLSLFFQL